MRKVFLVVSFTLLCIVGWMAYINLKSLYLLLILIPLIGMGLFDMYQSKRTIRRNFPLLGRMRYLLESIGPEMRQYFIETDLEGKPFNRLERSLVYQRSKHENDTRPFGTQLDLYEVGYQWINHSIKAIPFSKVDLHPRVKIGSSQCEKPYEASLYNISAMSYGSLSKNAILALNSGAQQGGFYHNTGEGGLSPYHLQHGADVVWNIGTGYFSCRDAEGNFCYENYDKRAQYEQVKMIEIKFSQGAKPGHGGILPKEKVTDEISDIRLVSKGHDIISPPYLSAFSNPLEFI